MASIKAVIFDLDDTLYPERAYALSGFAAVAAAFPDRLGEPAQAVERMQQLFDSHHHHRVFNAFLQEHSPPEDLPLVERMIQTYRHHKPIIALHPDADKALARLRNRYPLGLITDGPAVQQRAKIDALGLRDRFEEIIVTSELGPEFGKPHRRAFELITARFGAQAAECIYVADNPVKDFIAPRALGWTTVQITRPDGIYRLVQPAAGGEPGHIIDTLHDLDNLLIKAV